MSSRRINIGFERSRLGNGVRHCEAIAVLAQPDWRIELFGYDYIHDGVEMRAIGCGSAEGAGVIATQTPGEASGKIEIRLPRTVREPGPTPRPLTAARAALPIAAKVLRLASSLTYP